MTDIKDRITQLSPKQRSLFLLKELQQKLDRMERRGKEPIAVIGIGCRFPYDAYSPDEYWQDLRDAADGISEVPLDRWKIDEFYDPEMTRPDTMNTRWGGFLKEVDTFDYHFFGISRAEANSMDPQQRMLLEVGFEALENAAIAKENLKGGQTGVFVGISSFDYSLLSEQVPPRGTTGLLTSLAANRLSYFLDVHGPSMGVDTACSSSLVSTHLACQSLREGSSDLALSAGVNVILVPHLTASFSQAGMMAPDGRCKTFDASADGYVRSEGCGVVVLKRLSDALKDRHHIYGVILGSAINHDGLSNGLTAPNSLAQQAVIRKALENAGLSPGQIGYIEAHGTGTNLGDVIEVEALKNVFSHNRTDGSTCRIGSVKANIGHLEAASGIAGLIKGLLILSHGEIPSQLHLKEINPALELEGGLEVVTGRTLWERSETPRFLGISSFGVGGANAHFVLGEPPEVEIETGDRVDRPRHLLRLSAVREKDLETLAAQYAGLLSDLSGPGLADLCYTANIGRGDFEHRLAVHGFSGEDMAASLKAFLEGGSPETMDRGHCPKGREKPNVGFLFGPAWPGGAEAARCLYETQPVFRQWIDECAEAVGDQARTDCFALQIAIARLWQSWGMQPVAVGGVGAGLIAAACLAGAFSLADAARLTSGLNNTKGIESDRGLEAIGDVLKEISFSPLQIPFISDAVRSLQDVGALLEPEDLVGNAFGTEASTSELSAYEKAGCTDLLEIGATDSFETLRSGGEVGSRFSWRPSLRRETDPWSVLLSTLGALYAAGTAVNWAGFDRPYPRRRVLLPSYPFDRKRCWFAESQIRTYSGPFKDKIEKVSTER